MSNTVKFVYCNINIDMSKRTHWEEIDKHQLWAKNPNEKIVRVANMGAGLADFPTEVDKIIFIEPSSSFELRIQANLTCFAFVLRY